MSSKSSQSISPELTKQASKGLFAALANHRTAPNLIMIVLVVGGLWSLSRLNVQIFPDIVLNYIQVQTGWSGASAGDVDDGVTSELVPTVQAISDVKLATSYSVEGFSIIFLELDQRADEDKVQGEVLSAVDGVTLPKEADAPTVSKLLTPEPVSSLLISAPFSEMELLRVAEQVKDGLNQSGVRLVSVQGLRKPIIRIVPDESALRALNLTLQDVSALVGQRTQDVPAGALGANGTLVRSIGRVKSLEEISQIPVLPRPDGSFVRLADVAIIEQVFPDSGIEVRRKQNRAVEIVISRARGDDTLAIQDLVNAYIAGIRGEPRPTFGVFGLPFLSNPAQTAAWDLGSQAVLAPNVNVEPYDVIADFTAQRLQLLVGNGALGLVIVLVLLTVFLNWRTAFWVAVGIPISFAATFIVMSFTGQSLNFLATFGLLITLGIIVDDAIVVGEHADELASGSTRRPVDSKFRLPVLVGGGLFVGFLALLIGVSVLVGVPNAKDWAGVGPLVAPLRESLLWWVLLLAMGMFLSVAWAGLRLAREFPTQPPAGIEPKHAAVLAVQRMAPPVTAAAITTLIAFAVPMLIDGRLASFIAAIPLAVLAVLAASLIECFFVLPGHMRHALEARARQKDPLLGRPLKFFRIGFDWLFDGFRYGPFATLVRYAMRARYLVIGIALTSFILAIGEVATQKVRFTFFDGPSDGTVGIDFEMIQSAGRDDTRAHIDALEHAVEQAFQQTGVDMPMGDAVDIVIGRVGVRSAQDPFEREVDPDRVGSVTIYLLDPFQAALDAQIKRLEGSDALQEPTDYFAALVNEATPINPRLATQSARPGQFDGGGPQISIKLLDAEPAQLKAAAEDLAERLRHITGISGIEDDMAYGEAELELVLTDRGRSLGLQSNAIASQVGAALTSNEIFSINNDGIDVGVVVTQLEGAKTRSFLESLPLMTPSGAFIPLAQAVQFRERLGFGAIMREQNRPQINVTARLQSDSDLSTRDVEELLSTSILPKLQATFPVSTQLGGAFVETQQFINKAMVAAGLGLLGIYLVLAWVFASFWRPLVIMAIIPMGFVGMVYGHLIHGVDLSIFSVIGFMGLSGIIVNDSIVLISTIDRKAKDLGVRKATATGPVDRLRAVLLTSATTIGGLLPLVFEQSFQAQFLLPTTLTLVYGLGLGTLWVLFLVPALVGVQSDIAMSVTSGRRMIAYLLGRKPAPLGVKYDVLPIAPWREPGSS